MLHGLWFESGTVRYRNRWVQTQGLRAEERAGKALFGGLMTPAYVDQSLLGADPDPGWPSKLDAFVNIVHHDGRYLALEEGTQPYEVTAISRRSAGSTSRAGSQPAWERTRRSTRSPVRLVTFRYDVVAPFLCWAIVGADGTMVVPEIAVDSGDEGS